MEHGRDDPTNPHEIVRGYLFVIGASVCLFSLCFSVFLVHSLRENHTKDSYTFTYPTTYAAAILYFLSSIIYVLTLHHLDLSKHSNMEDDIDIVLCTMFFVLCLITARLSIFTQLIMRLYYTFKGTPTFALSRRTLTVSIALSALVFAAAIWWSVLITLRYVVWKESFGSYSGQLIAVTALVLVFDSTGSWTVVATMTNKLLQTIDFIDRSEVISRMKRLEPPPKDAKATPNTLTPTAEESTTISNVPCDPSATPTTPTTPTSDGDLYRIASPSTPQHREQVTSETFSELTVEMSQRKSHRETVQFQLDLAYNCFTDADRQRLNLITKLLLLSILSIITSQICYLSLIVALMVRYFGDLAHFNQSAFLFVVLGLYYPAEVA